MACGVCAGVGVFEYASTDDVQSQVYICPVATCHDGVECMSFITSLVVKTKTHTLVASGDSVTVDGMAPQSVWEHGMNHTLSGLENGKQEAMVTSVGKHDPNAKLMRVSPKELLKPKACQPDHKSLKMNAWVWHYCSPSGASLIPAARRPSRSARPHRRSGHARRLPTPNCRGRLRPHAPPL